MCKNILTYFKVTNAAIGDLMKNVQTAQANQFKGPQALKNSIRTIDNIANKLSSDSIANSDAELKPNLMIEATRPLTEATAFAVKILKKPKMAEGQWLVRRVLFLIRFSLPIIFNVSQRSNECDRIFSLKCFSCKHWRT